MAWVAALFALSVSLTFIKGSPTAPHHLVAAGRRLRESGRARLRLEPPAKHGEVMVDRLFAVELVHRAERAASRRRQRWR